MMPGRSDFRPGVLSALSDDDLFAMYEQVRVEVLRRFEPKPDPTGVSTWAGCPRCTPRKACSEHRAEAAAYYANVRSAER